MRLLFTILTFALGIVGAWPATNGAVLLTTLKLFTRQLLEPFGRMHMA